jgi:hypothetical protein
LLTAARSEAFNLQGISSDPDIFRRVIKERVMQTRAPKSSQPYSTQRNL